MPEELLSPSPSNADMGSSEAPAMPMDAAPQMPASEDPNKITITEEETKPTEITTDQLGDTQPASMDAAPQMPASEDPNKIVIGESDLPKTEDVSVAEATQASSDPGKIDLTPELSNPTQVASEESSTQEAPATPAETLSSTDSDKIDLSPQLSSDSSSTEASVDATRWTPEQEGQPATDTTETKEEPSTPEAEKTSIEKDSDLAQEIAMATDMQNTAIAALEKDTELSEERKSELISKLKDAATSLEEQIRQEYEKYEETYKKVQEEALLRLTRTTGSIFHVDIASDGKTEIGVYQSSIYEEIDQSHSAKLSNFLLKILGSDEKTLLSTHALGSDPITVEHSVNIGGQSATLIEAYNPKDLQSGKAVYSFRIIRTPANEAESSQDIKTAA